MYVCWCKLDPASKIHLTHVSTNHLNAVAFPNAFMLLSSSVLPDLMS